MAVLLAACGPSPGMSDASGRCPMTLPPCPSPAPSYASTVGPLIHDHCVNCHFAGSALAPIDLSTRAQVHSHQGVVLGQVYVCNMPPAMPVPPATSVPLVDADRETILAWLACGAPDN